MKKILTLLIIITVIGCSNTNRQTLNAEESVKEPVTIETTVVESKEDTYLYRYKGYIHYCLY